jgi:hypothetical protein
MLGGGSGDNSQQTVLEKEAFSESLKAVAFFPPLMAGDESRIAVKLTDLKSGKPVPRARISVRVQFPRDSTHENHAGGGMMMMHQMDSTQAHAMPVNQNAEAGIPVVESTETGTYYAYFTTAQNGVCKFIVTISSVEGYALEQPLIIEGTRAVIPMGEGHGGMGGMHGMGGSGSTWLIIGAAVMGAMMIVSWGIRGGMF